MSHTDLQALKNAVERLQNDPSLLHTSDYAFFREYLVSLGATLPDEKHHHHHHHHHHDDQHHHHHEDAGHHEPQEHDPEIWTEDDSSLYVIVIPIESPSEDDLDLATEKKGQAMEASTSEDKIKLMTEALRAKPESSMWWAARAQMYLEWKKARCAIKDANEALSRNADSAKALRVRGIAHRHLGHWEESAADLAAANAIDFDEKTAEIAKFVTEKATALRNARRRREVEAEEQKGKSGFRSAQASSNAHSAHADPSDADFAESLPPMFREIAKDPEVREALKQPGIRKKLEQTQGNPAAMMGLMNDPEVAPLFMKLAAKFGGGGMPGGMPGMGMPGMPGGMPGFPGGFGAMPRAAPGPVVDDDLE